MKRIGTLELLQRLARSQGIQTSYLDATRQTRAASPETLRALLGALGIQAASDHEVEASWQNAQQADPRFPPVIVLWEGHFSSVMLNFKQRIPNAETCNLHLEDGSTRLARLRREKRNDQFSFKVEIPPLPYGYHQLEVGSGEAAFRSLIISAPVRAWGGAELEKKRWGVFLPTYALHSKSSWGAGDFRDLSELGSWIGSLGGSTVATLPMLSSFLHTPFDPSPYSPASRLFWNEFYLRLPDIPEFSACRAARKLVDSSSFAKQLDRFRKNKFVDYRSEMAGKRAVLELLSKFLFSRNSDRRAQFERFLQTRPEVRRYARFRAVAEQRKGGWTNWPEPLRSGKLKPGDYSQAAEQYHMYVQWAAQEQIDQLRCEYGDHGVSLYLDLPLGVNSESFDVWHERALFVDQAKVGAPPDAFFTRGQDWGLAPMNPRKMRERGYRYFIDFLCFQMRQTGLLRLDHVMGLHRLYWIPRGFPASEGAFVRYPAEELYAILCLESHRNQTALVGENLGTVPKEVNRSMDRHRLKQMYIAQYEQRPVASACLRPPPTQCVAAMNTHDMPPFSAHWNGLDIVDRGDLGLISQRQVAAEKRRRRRANSVLVKFLQRKKFLARGAKPQSEEVMTACLRFLAASQAQLVLVNLEDIWSETQSQNTPGTTHERSNWSRKSRLSLEQIRTSKTCLKILAEVDRIRAGTKLLSRARNSRAVPQA